jgi:hypothetical protein
VVAIWLLENQLLAISFRADRIAALAALAAILQDVDFRPGGGDLGAEPP